MVLAKIVAVVMLVAAIGIRYWIRRREFYRRNPFGAQGFSSLKMIATRTFERFMGFISFALMLCSGLILLAAWLIKRSPDILS